MSFRSLLRQTIVPAVVVAGAAVALPAAAAPIDWASWSSIVTGSPSGSATATLADLGITASYTGELQTFEIPYPSYAPAGTFQGGNIDNAPSSADGIVRIFGGPNAGTNTITFSQAIVNPVMAIWSLGQPGITARFEFDQPFAIQSGGPSNEYGGSTITAVGNTVFGNEGNGTIQFLGTYTSLSWTNPAFENWYGFTVGATALAVPEPETYALMLAGLGLLGAAARRRRAR